MMSSYICCYNQETRELEHYKVPYDVSVYIKQLENEIKYSRGGVQKLYPFRFNEDTSQTVPPEPNPPPKVL
jgi:hypothetical protein